MIVPEETAMHGRFLDWGNGLHEAAG